MACNACARKCYFHTQILKKKIISLPWDTLPPTLCLCSVTFAPPPPPPPPPLTNPGCTMHCNWHCKRGFHTGRYVELRSASYRLRRACAALRSAYASLRNNTPMDAKGYVFIFFAYFQRRALDAESMQFVRKSTQHYAIVRHAYAIVHYPTPVHLRNTYATLRMVYSSIVLHL